MTDETDTHLICRLCKRPFPVIKADWWTQLLSLSKFKDGWDGMGAKTPSKKDVAAMMHILHTLGEGTEGMRVTHTAAFDGGLVAEVFIGDTCIEFDLYQMSERKRL